MAMPSYSELREQVRKDLANLESADAQALLVEHLAELRFELFRIKEQHRTLLAALRARDVLIRAEPSLAASPPARRLIQLDPRDTLDMAEGFHKLEWEKDVAIRWTGPDHETALRLWLDRSIPVSFEMALLSYGDERNRGAISLTVDGLPVPFHDVEEKLLRSDPFPLLAESLYSEIVIQVPFLLGRDPGNGAAPPRKGARRTQAEPSEADAAARRGIAVSHIRLFSAA